MLIAETMTAVSCADILPGEAFGVWGTADGRCFFTTTSSGAYLLTKRINPFPK